MRLHFTQYKKHGGTEVTERTREEKDDELQIDVSHRIVPFVFPPSSFVLRDLRVSVLKFLG
jgi:hypothetical protein